MLNIPRMSSVNSNFDAKFRASPFFSTPPSLSVCFTCFKRECNDSISLLSLSSSVRVRVRFRVSVRVRVRVRLGLEFN